MPRIMNRRTVLRGTATTIALPFLDAMMPSSLLAAKRTERPVRMLWLYTQSGMWMDSYKPTQTGRDWELSHTLEPLTDYRDHVSVLTGLRHINAFKRNPVVNRHGQDGTCHLTAADLGRIPGVAAQNSISIDQLAARHIGDQTRFPTLNIAVPGAPTISFNDNGSPMPQITRPDVLFDQLFAEPTKESKARMDERFRRRKSILDDVIEQTKTLNGQLGVRDREKLDEYLSRVREVERRLAIERVWTEKGHVPAPTGVSRPADASKKRSRTEQVREMFELISLAMQTDQSRIITFSLGAMGCTYPEIGAPDGYHGYTHASYNEGPGRQNMIKVDRARVEHVAGFIDKLSSMREGDQSVLHQSAIHYGSGMSSTHGEGDVGLGKKGDDLPNLLIGQGGGRLRPGTHNDYGRRPLADLYLRMLDVGGVPLESFVDGEEPLSDV